MTYYTKLLLFILSEYVNCQKCVFRRGNETRKSHTDVSQVSLELCSWGKSILFVYSYFFGGGGHILNPFVKWVVSVFVLGVSEYFICFGGLALIK